MDRPEPLDLTQLQHQDSPWITVKPNLSLVGTSDRLALCRQLMYPVCDSIEQPDKQTQCHQVSLGLCAAGSPFVDCMFGATGDISVGTLFMNECLCAPQALVVGQVTEISRS